MGRGRQVGAALAVSLVLLTVALLLGLSGMQAARLEETMVGNQRAATSALLAAEYGGAERWGAMTGSHADEEAFIASVDSSGWQPVPEGAGAHYASRVSRRQGPDLVVDVTGAAFSGDPAHGVPLATRTLEVLVRRDGAGFERLSALTLASPLAHFAGTSAGVEGGGVPAVAATSRGDAFEAVRAILGLGAGALEVEGHDDYVFVPAEPGHPGGHGVFHASPTVTDGVYTGDYRECDGAANALCAYRGGIGSRPAEGLLRRGADEVHRFVRALFDDAWPGRVVGSVPTRAEGVTVLSRLSHVEGGGYWPGVGAEDDYPERDTFLLPRGFSGSGLLLIDGHAVFDGPPEFEGVIIVLGNHEVVGEGGDGLRGAVVVAPYGCEGSGAAPACRFEPARVTLHGGGRGYRHDRDALDSAWASLAALGPAAAEVWREASDAAGGWSARVTGWVERVDR